MEKNDTFILYSIDLDCFASEYGCKLIVAARNVLEAGHVAITHLQEEEYRNDVEVLSWTRIGLADMATTPSVVTKFTT